MLTTNSKKFLERLIANSKEELAMAKEKGNLERVDILEARIKSYLKIMEDEND